MTPKEEKLYNALLNAFMDAAELVDKGGTTNGKLRAVVIGMKRTALANDARMKIIEKQNAPAPAKRTRKKKTEQPKGE